MSHALTLPANISLGSIDDYIGSVNVFPRLDAEEETALARRFRDEDDLDAARRLVMANFGSSSISPVATWATVCPCRT